MQSKSGEGDEDQSSFTGDWLIQSPKPEAGTAVITALKRFISSEAFKVELINLCGSLVGLGISTQFKISTETTQDQVVLKLLQSNNTRL